jgi:hypothetical protein
MPCAWRGQVTPQRLDADCLHMECLHDPRARSRVANCDFAASTDASLSGRLTLRRNNPRGAQRGAA